MRGKLILSTLFAVLTVQIVWGQIPQTMSYQGVLTDGSGNVVSDGSYNLTFKLYDAAANGTELWTETQSVDVSGGLFNVILGDVNPLNLDFDGPYWLGIAVGGGTELLPRIELTSSAYSLNAKGVSGDSNVFPSDGSVGIGTKNIIDPWAKLVVQRDSVCRLAVTDGTGCTILQSEETCGFVGSQNANFGLVSGGNTIMLLNTAGNVGVGTTEPTAKLHVGGVAGIDGIKFPDGTLQTTAAAGGGADGDWTISGNDMYSSVTGNIGIGTSTPQRKLHIADPNWVTLVLEDEGASADQRKKFINADDGKLRFGRFPDSWVIDRQMTIDNNGNVGIAMDNPGNILTIQQSSATDPIADAWTVYSSKRWKTNIKPIEGAMDKVQQLSGVSFDWKADGRHDIGLIAEEVGEVLPEVVAYEENGVDGKSVDYSRLVALLIEAVKEQQKEIEDLKQIVDALRGEKP